MSFDSMYFIYDNINSIDMGLYLVHLDSGFYGSPVGGSKTIVNEKVPYRQVPYRYRVDLDVMKFSVVLSPLEGLWTNEFKQQVFMWLNGNEPKAFQSCDNLGKMCYVTCVNPQEVFTAGLQQGYLQIDFEATTPYWLTLPQIATYDLSTIGTTPTTITMENQSNVPDNLGLYKYYPEIEVSLVGNTTGFSFYNQSDGNRGFGFSELNKGETLYINNQMRQIVSDVSDTTYRLGNMNFSKNWFYLIYGQNRINVVCEGGSSNTDGIIIQTKCQFPIYA